jgi:hypothetical protein
MRKPSPALSSQRRPLLAPQMVHGTLSDGSSVFIPVGYEEVKFAYCVKQHSFTFEEFGRVISNWRTTHFQILGQYLRGNATYQALKVSVCHLNK